LGFLTIWNRILQLPGNLGQTSRVPASPIEPFRESPKLASD
jgi:hypothetical protein